jgi:hypothetical protein
VVEDAWPLQPLLIALEGDGTDLDLSVFEALVEAASLPAWRLQLADDLIRETRGVVLWLRAPDASGHRLPRSEDLDDLAAARRVLALAAAATEQADAVLAVELNGNGIGFIEAGRLDSSLEIGLLEEWSRLLGETS